MMGSKKRNSGRDIRILASACLAAAAFGVVGAKAAHADVVIDLAFTNNSVATTNNGGSTQATNMGIVPVTNYGGSAPSQVAIPDAPSATYDAADEADTGTLWNEMESVSTAPTSNATGGPVNVLYESGIPLKDSLGNTTTATFSMSEILPNGKADDVHTSGSNSSSTGTDTLAPNPGSTTDNISGGGSSHLLMMDSCWFVNSTTEGLIITIGGLTSGSQYDLYIYSDGCGAGQGGSFSLASGNTGVAGDTTGAVTTNTGGTSSTWYRSVFSTATGNNPAPEKDLSWNELIATADGSGNVTFTETLGPGGVKEAIDGLQIDAVPEPASLGLLSIGAIALMGRRKRKA
jgi:hypothetical protein